MRRRAGDVGVAECAGKPRHDRGVDHAARPRSPGSSAVRHFLQRYRVRRIVTQSAALALDAPEFTSGRLDRHAFAIAQRRRDDLRVRIVRVEDRTDGKVQRMSIRRDSDVASIVIGRREPGDDLFRLGSEQAVKEAGLLKSEGKEYTVRDGDILFFKFNV